MSCPYVLSSTFDHASGLVNRDSIARTCWKSTIFLTGLSSRPRKIFTFPTLMHAVFMCDQIDVGRLCVTLKV